jgi:hypothetical protein
MEPDKEYSKKGAHMWKLLFSERESVPLPRSWHIYHFALVLIPPAAAWCLLSLTRHRMATLSAGLQAKAQEEAKEIAAKEEEKRIETVSLAEQLAELKKEVDGLKASKAVQTADATKKD